MLQHAKDVTHYHIHKPCPTLQATSANDCAASNVSNETTLANQVATGYSATVKYNDYIWHALSDRTTGYAYILSHLSLVSVLQSFCCNYGFHKWGKVQIVVPLCLKKVTIRSSVTWSSCFTGLQNDHCCDHKLVIARPAAYDHGYSVIVR